jgi:hypothetical protein
MESFLQYGISFIYGCPMHCKCNHMDNPAMNTRRIAIAASLCLYLLTAVASAGDYPPCDIGGNPMVAPYGDKGVLSVDAEGNFCYAAEPEIRIDTQDEESISKYNSELKEHTPIDWSDPDLDRYAKHIVSSVLKNFASAEELPPRTSQDIKIMADGYTLLKKKTGATSTQYEGEITLQYDDKTETAKIEMEAGF